MLIPEFLYKMKKEDLVFLRSLHSNVSTPVHLRVNELLNIFQFLVSVATVLTMDAFFSCDTSWSLLLLPL